MTDPMLLVGRAKRGDLAAFEQLLVRHERLVLGTALRLLGRLEDAQDAAQEVFLKLHRNLHQFDEVRDFTPWLYRVTVNVCRDQQRARTRKLHALDSQPEQADAGPSPETSVLLDEHARVLADG